MAIVTKVNWLFEEQKNTDTNNIVVFITPNNDIFHGVSDRLNKKTTLIKDTIWKFDSKSDNSIKNH